MRVLRGPAIAIRELRAWQLRSGGRGSEPIIGQMSANALKLWGPRHLRPAIEAATDGRVTNGKLYTLRHSHASACHYVTGLTDVEIMRRLGHKAQVHYQHYAHIIDGIEGQRYVDLDELITVARGGADAFTEVVKRASAGVEKTLMCRQSVASRVSDGLRSA